MTTWFEARAKEFEKENVVAYLNVLREGEIRARNEAGLK